MNQQATKVRETISLGRVMLDEQLRASGNPFEALIRWNELCNEMTAHAMERWIEFVQAPFRAGAQAYLDRTLHPPSD